MCETPLSTLGGGLTKSKVFVVQDQVDKKSLEFMNLQYISEPRPLNY